MTDRMTNTPSEQPAIPEGMVRWAGERNDPPADWHDGDVLYRSGVVGKYPWTWSNLGFGSDIIAYTPAIPASAGEAWLDSYSARNPDLEDSFTRDDMLLAFEAGARAIEQPAQASEVERYRAAGNAIAEAWNSNACSAQDLPPIELTDSDRTFLGKAAVDALAALNPSQERVEAGK